MQGMCIHYEKSLANDDDWTRFKMYDRLLDELKELKEEIEK